MTISEIFNTIQSLRNKKSGEDKVPINILKKGSDIISEPLTHIINLCFREDVFPDS